MADIKETLSILAVKLAERAAAAAEFATAEATNAYKTGLNTAISLLEQAAASRPEGTLADRVHIVLLNLEAWKQVPLGMVLPTSPIEAYRLGLARAQVRLEAALLDQPMPLTGDGDVAQTTPQPEVHPLNRFRELAKLWRDIQVGRLNAAAGDLAGIRYALDQCSDQLIAVLEGTPVEATFWSGAIPASRFEPKPVSKEEENPFAPACKPAAPLFTKCEQLIYDVARQALAEPSLRTRAQLTQQLDYWLYQLQNANLARPKPELPPAATGVAG